MLDYIMEQIVEKEAVEESPKIFSTLSRAHLSKVSYMTASERTQQRSRKAADEPLRELLVEKFSMNDDAEIATFLTDYVEHTVLKKRTHTEVEDKAPSFDITARFKNMTELDQQMFLLNMEVDGSDISEALNLICPGPGNKNVRQRVKRRYLKGGRATRCDKRDQTFVNDWMHDQMRVDTFGHDRLRRRKEGAT
jgi:hypothetical protein